MLADLFFTLMSTLIPSIIVLALISSVKRKGKRGNGVTYLKFGLPWKIASIVLVLLTAFVLFIVSHTMEEQPVMSLIVGGFFVAFSILIIYQGFIVTIGFDNNFIYYSVPFLTKKKIAFKDIKSKRYYSKLI